jgi:hypothetical protein
MLNVIGLSLTVAGSVLLALYSFPPLDVTKEGASFTTWMTTPSDPAVIERNKRRYKTHTRGSRWGICLLVVGCFLQFVAAVVHFIQ